MLADLLTRYGYAFVLLGTFFEGESFAVIAGYAAHAGHLSLPWVIVCAFVGSLCGDQVAYLLGRSRTAKGLGRRESWRPKLERVRALLERHSVLVMLGFRFLYGIRTVTPFAIGWTGVRPRTFVPRRYEEWVILSIGVVGIVAWLVRRRRRVVGPR